MSAATEKIGRLIRAQVSLVDRQAEVILFGSRARGDSRKDSDWDILILTDNPLGVKQESQLRDLLYDVELETGEPLSLQLFSKSDWYGRQRVTPFFANVTEEGIRL